MLRSTLRFLNVSVSAGKNNIQNVAATVTPVRHSSYGSSKPEGDPSLYTQCEIIQNPEEWKYVERLIPKMVIPKPSQKEVYPSGWRPVTANPECFPYFVERNKNHLMPVYLNISKRGTRRLTKVMRVSGDIWLLKDLLHKHLEIVFERPVGVQVDELAGTITFRGDYVNDVKYWLEKRGF